MKQFTFIVTCIFLTLFSRVLHAQTKLYKGTLGDRQIEMHLLFGKVGIFGYFTFAGDTGMHQLHSQEDKRNRLLEQDEMYGAYINIAVRDKAIKGTWFDPGDSTKKQLSVVQTGTENIDAMFAGYSDEYGDISEGYRNTITFCVLSNKFVFFEASVNIWGAINCVGYVSGIATYKGNDTWTYSSGEECRNFSMSWKDGHIIVDEGECKLHGANCTLSGTY
jgi:hypothetical protein